MDLVTIKMDLAIKMDLGQFQKLSVDVWGTLMRGRVKKSAGFGVVHLRQSVSALLYFCVAYGA